MKLYLLQVKVGGSEWIYSCELPFFVREKAESQARLLERMCRDAQLFDQHYRVVEVTGVVEVGKEN